MTDPIVNDKAKWHHEHDSWPAGLSEDHAYTHTGMFVRWLAEHGVMSPELLDDFRGLLTSRWAEAPGTRLYHIMDGGITSEDLTDEGNAFAAAYFDFERGVYLHDYEALLAVSLPTMYHVADIADNYARLRARIDERYEQWKAGTLPVQRQTRGRGRDPGGSL